MSCHLKITAKKIGFITFFLIFVSVSFQSIYSQHKPFIIVLDAGHGGKDSGNLGTRRYKTAEKDIALDVTLKVGKLLEKKLKGVKVIYTRKKDVYPDLWKRAEIANKANADFFVSIHCNAAAEKAYGTETFVLGINRNKTNLEVAKRENDVILLEKDHEKHYHYNPNSPESIIGLTLMQEEYLDKSIDLAKLVEKNFVKDAKRGSRGVKQAGLIVLHQTYMPSVLIEIGFLTNRREEDYLNSSYGQNEIANAIFQSIKAYKQQVERNTIFIKNPIAVNKKIVKPTKTSIKNISSTLIYKVQIASGSRKLLTKSYNFKGLKGIERIRFSTIYKYYFGKSSSLSQIKRKMRFAKKKGFKTAFIVAFKNGKKINL